jgi:hypothetical protein
VGIVVVPPFLNPAPGVADNGKVVTTASVVVIDPSAQLPVITHKVYLNVKFGSKGGKKCRVVIGLFGDVMPRRVGNFLALCTNCGNGNAKGPPYVGSTFYRGEAGLVFFIMPFCRVLKWMPNFPCSIFAVIDHITPLKHQTNTGCSFR